MPLHVFDATAQERSYLQDRLSDLSPVFHDEPLTAANAPADADAVSVFIHSTVDAATLAALPALKLLVTRSTGFDHIDLAACAARGVTVCNVPTYGENTVAEHAFALLMALARHIPAAVRTREGDFRQDGLQGFDIEGLTLGVIGSGHIGQHAIKIGVGFGMKVVAYDAFPNNDLPGKLGFTYVSLDDLLAQSDVITLHAPLLPATTHIVNRERLARCKDGVVIINTARGELIDLAALVEALESGKVGAAGLDVWEFEALVDGKASLPAATGEDAPKIELIRRLMTRDNVLLTPHVGFDTVEAIHRILDTVVGILQAYRQGAEIPDQVHPKA